MDMSFTSRPKLIDRLRLFHVLRRHIGEEDAEAVVDALQDEFSEVSMKEDLSRLNGGVEAQLKALRAEMDSLRYEMTAEINGAMLKLIGAMGLVAGVALAIARLT